MKLDISAVIETLFVNIGKWGGGGNPNPLHRKHSRKHKRTSRIEELEPREMLSVNMLGFDFLHNDNLNDTGFVDVHSPPLEGWHFAQQNDGVVADAQDDHPAAARHPSTGGELVAPAPSVANAPPANAHADDLAVYNDLRARGCRDGDFEWNSEGRIDWIWVLGRGLTGTLDVSTLAALEYLACVDNNLTSLNVSGLTALEYLYCFNNNLTELNLFGTPLENFASAKRYNEGTHYEYEYPSDAVLAVDKTVTLLNGSQTPPTDPGITTVTPGVVTDASKIDKKAAKVSGVKVAKGNAKPTQTSLTFSWTPPKSAKSLELLDADGLTFDILAPKPKEWAKTTPAPCVATATIGWSDINALMEGGSLPPISSGGCTISISISKWNNYYGYQVPTIEIKVLGLNAGTKYTVEMQAQYGSQSSSVTKTSGTTAKYNAVTNDKAVTKQTVVGQVTLGWKDAKNMPTGTGVTYEVGIWVGKVAVFNPSEFNEAVKLLKNDKAKDTANAIWSQVKDQIGDNGTATSKTFYGVSLKCTYAVRATATVEGGYTAQSAVAKIAVTPLKYPAPKTLTQPTPGTMSFNWTAPDLKNNTTPSSGATVTYTIGVWDTKGKKFSSTVVSTTYQEGLTGLTTDALTGVAKDNVIAVQQVIKFANGNVVSAVKTLKVK